MTGMPKFLRKFSEFFLDTIETLVIALSIFLVVYLFFMQPHQVNGQSMMPNFASGEYVLTDKVSYRFSEPKRGDVVVFHAPDGANCPAGTGCDFIKRIIAVPGETLALENNQFIINGVPLIEDYIPDDFETLPGPFLANRVVTLGPNEYFTVGDNRSFSSDSRAWGPVGKEDIVGRAFFRYWPPQSIGILRGARY